jgi:hypothetical protein
MKTFSKSQSTVKRESGGNSSIASVTTTGTTQTKLSPSLATPSLPPASQSSNKSKLTMLNYVDLKLRQTLQQEKIEKEKREEIMMDMQNQEEKMSDIQLTKLLLDIPQPYISAQSWAVYDTKTESVLFGRLERERREIASLTKIMTTCVVLNLLKKFNLDERKEMVDISVNASET